MRGKLLGRFGLILVLMVATLALSAAVFKTVDYSYSRLDKAFYLSDKQIAFVRPGLNLEMDGWAIGEDRSVSVDFTVADDAGNTAALGLQHDIPQPFLQRGHPQTVRCVHQLLDVRNEAGDQRQALRCR